MRKKLHLINLYLIILLGFFIPISIPLGSIISSLIFLLWIIDGNFKYKLNKIIENKAILAFILLFSIYIIGLIYTSDLEKGLYILKKARYLLLAPVIYTIINNEKMKEMAIKSFIVGVISSVFITYLIYFKILKFDDATIIHHGYYSIHLSFAIFWLLNSVFKQHSRYLKIGIFLIIILMTINLFIQPGRVGQLAFFVLTIFFGTKRYGFNGMLYGIIIAYLLAVCFYKISPTFKARIDVMIEDITQFKTKVNNTGVGIRLVFWENTLKIIKKNPIIGVGTGDFDLEYAKIIPPQDTLSDNPHNNYLLILALFGISGFIIFINLFYQLFRYSLSSADGEIIQLLLIPMLIFMCFNSPLMRHGMLFFTYLSGVMLSYDKGRD